jgi:hypothetical protein
MLLPGWLAAQPAKAATQELWPDTALVREFNRLAKLYHLDSAALARCDKIITFDREVYVGKIFNITFAEVRLTYPGESSLHALARSRISQILYADGRRDVFIALDDKNVKQTEWVDTARIIVKSQKDWMKVQITENPEVVKGLVAKGIVKANYEAPTGNADNEDLMRHASHLLKKKAAALHAHCVLIETKFFHKSYGDLPRVEVTARAFAYK